MPVCRRLILASQIVSRWHTPHAARCPEFLTGTLCTVSCPPPLQSQVYCLLVRCVISTCTLHLPQALLKLLVCTQMSACSPLFNEGLTTTDYG